MKNNIWNWKGLVLLGLALFITVCITLWISGFFKKSQEKKEYKYSVEQVEKLKEAHARKMDSVTKANDKIIDSLALIMSRQDEEIEKVKIQQNENEKKYQELYDLYLSDGQLDSLLTEFERKNYH